MLALIDADIVAHRVGFTTENDEEWIYKVRCDEMIEGMLHETGATEYQLWLSDSLENNFRLRICPEYKANRLGKPKPKWHEQIKEYLIKEWDARIAYNQEADDSLGIEQRTAIKAYEEFLDWEWDTLPAAPWNSIICSIDKDLLQIPGQHYNFVKKEHQFVTPNEGLTHFYRQLLIGDSSDNIQGCPLIGEAKAGKALSSDMPESEMFNIVVNLYRKQCKGLSDEIILNRILVSGQLLKIRQKENEIWQFPVFPK